MKVAIDSLDAAISASTDLFGRDAFADGMLRLFGESVVPLVVALDEPWGTGKTVFARRLQSRARLQGFKTVYFDAFRADYTSDAFVSLSAAVIGEIGVANAEGKSFKRQAAGVAKIVGRVTLKGLVRAATAGLVRASDFSEANAEVADEIGEEVEAELDKLIDDRLSSVKAEEAAFEKFSESLIALASSGQGKPLIFIVDEIDRCRPDYALSIIEVIRHFFSVPKVHFFLMAKVEYLASCVNARYGSGLDGRVFLEKFIHARVSFPVPEKYKRKEAIKIFVSSIVKELPDDGENGKLKNGIVDFISELADLRSDSFRRTERILTQFGLCLAFSRANSFRLGALVHVLCDLKITKPILFEKAKIGELEWVEVKDIYGFAGDKFDWYTKWLRYFLDKDIDRSADEWQSYSRSLWNWNLSSDPLETVKYVANNVVDGIAVTPP